jgi:hypothetical protein
MNIDLNYTKLNLTTISENRFEVVDELTLIPRGSFAGTIYQLGLVRGGQLVASDTAEQGGGQS